MSQTKFHQIRIKVIHAQIPIPKWEKSGKRKTFSGLQNGTIRGLQIGAGFLGLQVGARRITNRGTFKYFKSGQRLQIEGRGISNRCRATCV